MGARELKRNLSPKRFDRSSFRLLIFSFLLGSLLFCCSSQSQNRGRMPELPQPEAADQILADMKKQAKLTDDQAMNIRPIIEEQVQKRSELVQKYQGRPRRETEALRDELKDLRVSTESKLQYFLSNEQMIAYGYMQQEEDQRISTGRTQDEEGQKKPPKRRGGR